MDYIEPILSAALITACIAFVVHLRLNPGPPPDDDEEESISGFQSPLAGKEVEPLPRGCFIAMAVYTVIVVGYVLIAHFFHPEWLHWLQR